MKLKIIATLAAILPTLTIAAPAKPSSGRASQSKPAQSRPQERASSGRNSSSKPQDNKPQRGRNSQNRTQDSNKPANGRANSRQQQDAKPARGRNSQSREHDNNRSSNGRAHSRQQQETKPANTRTNARQQRDTGYNATQSPIRHSRPTRRQDNEQAAYTPERPQPNPEPQDNSPQDSNQAAEHAAAKAQCLRYVVDGNNLSAFTQACRPDAATEERYQTAFKNTQTQFEHDSCLDIVSEDEAQAAINLELQRLGQTSRLFCPAVKDELPGIAHRYRNVK